MVSFNEDCFHKCFKSARDSTRDSHGQDSINNSRSFNNKMINGSSTLDSDYHSRNKLKSCEEAAEDQESNEKEVNETTNLVGNNHTHTQNIHLSHSNHDQQYDTNDQELLEKRQMLRHECKKLDKIFDKNINDDQ